MLALDEIDNAKYRNPFELNKVVKERMPDKSKRYYEAKGALNYINDHRIQPFAFERDSLSVEVLTYVISLGQLESLAKKNEKRASYSLIGL